MSLSPNYEPAPRLPDYDECAVLADIQAAEDEQHARVVVEVLNDVPALNRTPSFYREILSGLERHMRMSAISDVRAAADDVWNAAHEITVEGGIGGAGGNDAA